MASEVMSDATQRQELADELAKYGVRVAQPDDPPLFTKEPKSSMQPFHWKAADLARLLEKIGASLKLEKGGQRRTLRLTNPGLPYGTTPTFWASIQYILPGEIASAHRHAATALRFIMEGSGADTIVDGEQYIINEGDLVLTPSWTWHDHEHKGSKPMIWLDVLDISLVRSLHATFFEGSNEPRQSVNRVSDRSYREFGSGLLRPMHEERSGGPALPTIGTAIQVLRPGAKCKPHRHTGSVVYYVVRGQGTTVIDGEQFDWSKGDFLALPPWAVHAHQNRSDKVEAVLFQVNDIPVLKSLGLYREEAA